MDAANIFALYDRFADDEISDRFVKHSLIEKRIAELPKTFNSKIVGSSAENRPVYLVTSGQGPIKIMLWSQMHGDEATGTMALLDLINFIDCEIEPTLKNQLLTRCTLYLIPMINPDGAERFTRRNAQQLDINRDYRQTRTPEAKILRAIRQEIKPHFGFNLHDQDTLWSVGQTGNPATLSFLAPAFDASCAINKARESAMLVIADIFESMNPLLPHQIALFEESYEARAFGDNFQAEGTATILIEAGGIIDDPEKQEIRKYFFLAMLAGLNSIASNHFFKQKLERYQEIPTNSKTIFHILIHQLILNGVETSVGINFIEYPTPWGSKTVKKYYIADIGDLQNWSAYETYNAKRAVAYGPIMYNEPAHFDFITDENFILSFKDGILQSKQ